jgi:Family of unknown function (DUF6065)
MFFQRIPQTIRFLCDPKDEGVIAPPMPARSYLSDWFRKLPAITPEQVSPTDTGLTVKRCMPFLDAMTTGWILTLPATLRMEIADGGKTVNTGWDFDRPLTSNHGMHQVKGNPRDGLPPCKFHNFWTIITPPGWSCLFINPLNRPNGLFEVVAGVVDTDTYRSPVHFPFFATGPDGLHTITKGSPIVQVIPFRRDAAEIVADIRAEHPGERDARVKILRNTTSETGWYRTTARAKR